MASFSTQVQFYAGDISGQTTEIVQWLPDAVKAVVSRIEAANPGLLHMFAAETVLNATDGVSFDTTAKGRILDVQRDSKRCSPVSPQYRAKIGDNTSIYYAPITDPKYYILNGTLTVLPTPTNAAPAQVSSVAYGAISDANGTIASFPSEFYRHVILWVAMNVIHSKLIDLRVALPTDLDADTTVFNAVADLDLSGIDTLPTSPDAPDYGSIAGFGQAPTYTKPTIGLTGASPDVVIPAFPSITDLDLTTDNALIDINPAGLDAPALSSAPTVADPSGSAPAYTKPTLVLGTAPTISNLSITAEPPDSPTIATISYSTASNSDASATGVSTATASEMTIVDVSSNAPDYTAPVFTSASTYLTEMEAGTIGAAASDIDIEHWFSIAGQIIEDEEDIELAQVHLQKISTFLQAFQADMQNQLNIFNEENARYQMEFQEAVTKENQDLQVAIANANNLAQEYRQEAQQSTQLDQFNKSQDQALNLANAAKEMEDDIADNNSKIQKYSAELQQYQAEVAMEVQEYQQNLAGDLQVWQTERQTDLQKYASDIQNELNEFNKENVAYQGKLQEYITEAQLEGSHDGNLLNKYAAQIQEYQMQVNNAVQAYQNNELQNKFQKWTTDYTNKLQEYSLAIQQELNEFNKESTVYQATIQKNVTEFAAKDTEYAAGLQEYATEMAEFQALIGKEVTQYTTDLGKKIQLYQAVIQKDTVDYQWLQGQLGYVQAMYEQCWAPYMAGASPDKNTSFVGVQK